MSTFIRNVRKCPQCPQMSKKKYNMSSNVQESAKFSSKYTVLLKCLKSGQVFIGRPLMSINVRKEQSKSPIILKCPEMSSMSLNPQISNSWCFWRVPIVQNILAG